MTRCKCGQVEMDPRDHGEIGAPGHGTERCAVACGGEPEAFKPDCRFCLASGCNETCEDALVALIESFVRGDAGAMSTARKTLATIKWMKED